MLYKVKTELDLKTLASFLEKDSFEKREALKDSILKETRLNLGDKMASKLNLKYSKEGDKVKVEGSYILITEEEWDIIKAVIKVKIETPESNNLIRLITEYSKQ